MRSKTDIAADLVFAALTPEKRIMYADFREYLDFYADIRAMDAPQEVPGPIADKKPLPAIAACPAPELSDDNACPAPELSDDNACPAAPDETSDVPGNEHVFVGKGAAEKREIHDRLLAYREANGIGCLAPLAAAAKGVSQEDLRMMLGSAPVSLAKWLAVGRALEKIEKAAPGAGTPETAKEN